MAAAELKLQVGLDLAFFRQQLAQLASTSVGYSLPINIDRLGIQEELNKLGANIKRRTYRLEIATNIATEIKNAGTLAKALRGLDNAIQKNKGVANRTGGGATGSVVDASKLEKSLKTATKPVLESVYNEMDRLGIRMAKAANDAGKTTNESLRAAILSGIPQVTADMAQGLAKGINPLMQINGQKGAKLFIDAWKDAAGIASPSKVFKEIGKNIIDGLEIGLQDFDALKTKMIGEMREFAAAMKREAKVGGIGIGGLLSPIARPQGAATKTIPGVLSPMGGVSSDPGRGNQKILNSLSLLTGNPALYRKRMSSVGPERLPSSLLGAAQSQFSLESLAPSFKQARLASKVSPLDKIIDEAFFGRGTLPKAQSALSSLSNSLERLGTATRAAIPSGILRDASGNARTKAFGGVDPSQTMGIFPPMGKTPTSAPGGSFLQFSQRATAVSAGLQQPSAPFPMGGGGAPPIPPTPPRGGQGGAGGFGGRLSGVLAGASLPSAGLVEEIGSEFGYAAKQVLLFGAAYRGLAFLTDFPAQVGNAVASLQTYRNTLTAVTGGGAEFSKSNQFVLDLVEKYNIPLQSARDGFTKLYASMAPAGFKGDEIRNIFTGISQGAATFGMSADKVDRVNYAFAQMASKGQVMSEELKGQLGDVLPGAVAIFAKAAGFKGPQAMVEFTKAMEEGRYKGDAMKQLLINVGIVMKKEFGPGAEGAALTFQGVMNRMQNATTKLYEAFEPMAIGFANQVVLPMTQGLKIATDGFNAFFTGQKATTKGGAELASKLQELKPTFEGLANNIKSVIDRVVDLGKVFLPILELGARLLSSPLAGALAQIYVSTLLLNGAFSMLATSGIAKTAAALVTSLIPATQQSTFFMYRLTLVTRGMWLAMTGPVGIAVLAIAAVTAALYAMHEPSREYLNTVPDRFADFWRDLASQANASGQKVQEMWRQVQKFFGDVINYIVKAFNEGMGKLPPEVKSAINQILPMLKELEPGFDGITKNIITNWKKMIAEILMATNPVLRLAKILGVDVATSAVDAATKDVLTDKAKKKVTDKPLKTEAPLIIPPIPGAGDDPTAAAKAKTLYENQKAYADKLSAAQTEADIKRQTTLFDNEKSMINMAYDLREARANSFEKETIRFQKELFNIEMTRQKAVMDANNEITKAQGKVAGGTGAIAPSSGFIDKSVLQTWLTSQGFGRTSGDFTNKGHATPNHMLNAMDMGILGGSDADALRKTKAMEERLKATGAFGNQLFGPTRDPMGHGAGKGGQNIHLHIPTPGGKVPMTPGLATLMNYSGATNAIGTGGKVSASQSRTGLAAQAERNALRDRTTKLTLAEVEAIKQAEIATANYVASIMPVAEQELQNKLLQRRTELMRTGITPDQIDTEMKIYEAQQKQTIGIQAAQKEIAEVTKLKNEGKLSSEDAARAIAKEQKVIDELTNRLDPYTKAVREAALANKDLAVQVALTDLENRAQMARAFTPEAEMRVRIKQQHPKATESQLGDLFKTEQTVTKAEELKTQMQGVASTIGDAFSTAFQGIINGSMSAQEALGNMFKSIGESFVKMAMDIIAKQMVMIVLGFLMKALGLGSGGGLGNAKDNMAMYAPLPAAANGATFSNGIAKFAHGGIVNGPTLFPFADGGAMQMGLMGEAGPEAIMPLQRGADGALGVRAAMGGNSMGGSSSPILNMNFETSTINGVEYVSRDQLEAAMMQTRRQASSDGAKRGMAMTLDKIQQSPQTRRRIGM